MTETIEQKLSRLAVKYPELAVKWTADYHTNLHKMAPGLFARWLATLYESVNLIFELGEVQAASGVQTSPYLIDNPDLTSGDNPLSEI